MGLFSRRARPPLEVRYQAKSTTGGIDQTLTLHNTSETTLVPTLAFQAHDHYGRVLPNVEVGTVLGVDRGAVAVAPGQTVTEVLRFRGTGFRAVRGVTTALVDLAERPDWTITPRVESLMVTLESKRTLDPEQFWGIGVTNPHDVDLDVRFFLIEFETDTPRDDPRQVIESVRMEDPVRIAQEHSHVVWLPEEVRGQFHDVLHVVEPPPVF